MDLRCEGQQAIPAPGPAAVTHGPCFARHKSFLPTASHMRELQSGPLYRPFLSPQPLVPPLTASVSSCLRPHCCVQKGTARAGKAALSGAGAGAAVRGSHL